MADDSADDRWTVRGVPKRVREAVADAARRRKVQVGEWACEAFDSHIQAEREPVDLVTSEADRTADRSDVLADPFAQLAILERAISAAAALAAAENVPVAFRRRANRLLREALPTPAARSPSSKRQRLLSPSNGHAASNGVGNDAMAGD